MKQRPSKEVRRYNIGWVWREIIKNHRIPQLFTFFINASKPKITPQILLMHILTQPMSQNYW